MNTENEPVPASPASSVSGELAQVVNVVMRSQQEQAKTHERILRRDLRWRMVRAVVLAIAIMGGALIYSFGFQHLFAPEPLLGPYAALVRIEGLIDADQRSNAHKIIEALRAAFDDPKAKGVVVLVNSPGGSPVQAALIHDRLLTLREQHPDKTLWVVGEDMLTSGAYYVAVASSHICVNRSTMAGSIGVMLSGWGLDRAIERFGIERRVITAGTNKARLDTFRPLSASDRAKATSLLNAIHRQFISAVEDGRGDRLKGPPEQLFSGDYWVGEQAVALGLVDGLCDLDGVLEKQWGVHAVRDFTVAPSLFSKLANSFGTAAGEFVTSGAWGPEPRLIP